MPRYNGHVIEPKWQDRWERQRTFRAVEDPAKRKLYVLDMFPYPSGEGLHVGHPEGYTATDVLCRYQRMRGLNVLHPMGYDAFGLPAEQYAIQTGTHPAVTTEKNPELATTDAGYVKWTQWIFLVLFDTWFDPARGKGRPIGELPIPPDVDARGEAAVRRYQDSFRLAYLSEAPVNWCAELGTVLADEEVINGRSERGNHPVQRLPLRQWMLRITAYADRPLEDLDALDWPEPIKEMQRNWVGRSEGAEVDFPVDAGSTGPAASAIRVYTTRPDTLFGATYMVLAPEHPLVDRLTAGARRPAVDAYREKVVAMSEEDRITGRGEKSGVFTGGDAINPVNGERIPVWIADYVLVSYGTGAIMAVPAHDQRDFEFAKTFGLPIRPVVLPPDGWLREMAALMRGVSAAEPAPTERQLAEWRDRYVQEVAELPFAFTGDGHGRQSANAEVSLDGRETSEANQAITFWLTRAGLGCAAVKYKLRDWLFSRQRYWGEPFPILHEVDERGRLTGLMRAVPVTELPVRLPELADFEPTGRPEPPLEKATEWVWVDGGRLKRETNTMSQWAGSCWYYLRFCDPRNDAHAWSPEAERYWMPVDPWSRSC